MKICYIIVLFLISCSDNETKNSTPKRPKNITTNAQWYGGLDGGLWFTLLKLNEKEYRIQNYLENGDKHWDANFIIDRSGFELEKPYEYIFQSDYTKCTIKQENRVYVFTYLKDTK